VRAKPDTHGCPEGRAGWGESRPANSFPGSRAVLEPGQMRSFEDSPAGWMASGNKPARRETTFDVP